MASTEMLGILEDRVQKTWIGASEKFSQVLSASEDVQSEQSDGVACAEGNRSEAGSTVSTQDEESRRDVSFSIQGAGDVPKVLDRTSLSSKAKPFRSSRFDYYWSQYSEHWRGNLTGHTWSTPAKDGFLESSLPPASEFVHFDLPAMKLGMEPPGLDQHGLQAPPGLVIGPPPGFEDADFHKAPVRPEVLSHWTSIDSPPQSDGEPKSSALEALEDKVKAHEAGTCVPCAYLVKHDGCRNGDSCSHCHLCPPGELRRRKKLKKRMLRAAAA